MQEREREGVAFVKVGNVGIEACEGVLVGEEANIWKFPPKDCETMVLVGGEYWGKGDVERK